MFGLTGSLFNDPFEKKAVAWTLHCKNPDTSWTWDFDAWEEFQENYEERARWGECSGVTVHYEDGTKKEHKMNAWSNG